MSGLRLWLAVLLGFMSCASMTAQQMDVLEFAKFKASQPGQKVDRDRQGSIIDFSTGESGFTFLADGTAELKAKEGDGVVRVIAPRKTSFIVIKHPVYGQCTWKAPLKLKRFSHYSAYLMTYSPDKLYKLSKQWFIVNVWPEDAIVKVDSTTTLVRDGKAQFYLPLGTHKYVVEAPFHTTVTDTVSLTDSHKEEIDVNLQPFYSYLAVKSGSDLSDIYIDKVLAGKGEITTGRLNPGQHRLTVIWDGVYYYDADIEIEGAEKKVVELDKERDASLFWQSSRWGLSKEARANQNGRLVKPDVRADVQITASGADTQILINREPVGSGSWKGSLPRGLYMINTRRDGVESKVDFLRVEDSSPIVLQLAPPEADYATLSVHSNVIGAELYVNDSLYGVTPCVVQGLPGGKMCKLSLHKEGYRNVTMYVKPHGNDMNDVEIIMKAGKAGKQ